MYTFLEFMDVCFGSFLLLCFAGRSRAESEEDRAAMEAIVQTKGEAWNRGDADAFAANYAEDGSLTNVIGQQLYGKKAFVGQHARIFSTIYKESHNTLSIGKIKFLLPHVAVVDIDTVVKVARGFTAWLVKAGEYGALPAKLQEVMMKKHGGWQIARSTTSRCIRFHGVVRIGPRTPKLERELL